MNWRRQNVLSVVAIVALVALNMLPAGDPEPRASRAVMAHR